MSLTCPPALPSASETAALAPTVGVEEEFFLLQPDGCTASVAPQLLAALSGSAYVHAEWMQFQVETVTGICTDLAMLAAEMGTARRAVAHVASNWGASLVAVGTPPFAVPGLMALTDDVRYRHLWERFPEVAAEVVANGCHVHVGVPTRDLGVQVLNRVRGWLPVLLALSGNSPLWRGRDSGWESYRYEMFTRWPTATAPPMCEDAATYDAALAERIRVGAAADAAGVYWLARLSPRFPTVEIRIGDAGLTVADTTLLAALCRSLVATALAEAALGRPLVPLSETVLATSLMSAARYGLEARLIDPDSGVLASGHSVLHRLVAHIDPALAAAGDRSAVATLLAERLRQGSGAARQIALHRWLDRPAFVAAVAAATLNETSWP